MPPVGFEPTILAGERPQTGIIRAWSLQNSDCSVLEGLPPSCCLMFMRVVIIRCKESFKTAYVKLKSSARTATLDILNIG